MRIKAKSIDQRGVVSFITVSFLAGILILITMGFMRVMISNQRQSLDNQLSTQAFYAAESGINDVRSKLPFINSDLYGLNNNCNGIISSLSLNNSLSDPDNIKYSCLLVDNTVEEIIISDATTANGVMYQLQGEGNSSINSVRVSWGSENQTSTRPNNLFPPASSWGANTTPALLRVTFYYPYRDVGNGVDFSRMNLISKQRTFFLVPNNNGNNHNVNTGDGSVTGIACSSATKYGCSAIFDLSGFLVPGQAKDALYIRIKPIYNDEAPIKIEAYTNNIATNRVDLINAQYVIDVTGRANDVYKRIKVRVPIHTEFNYPEYVAESANSICKQFITYPGFQQDEADCSLNP